MNPLTRRMLLLPLALLAAAPAAHGQLQALTDDQLPTLAPMLEKVRPAVVNVATTGSVPVEQNPLLQDPFFRRFFELPEQPPQEQQAQSLGSGVIIDDDKGYILTNAHVVEAADEITVTLEDGRELPAKLVGSDSETDIAVIQVEQQDTKLVQAPLGDSDRIRVGDFVVAVGSPFGLGQTATSGIVSGLERTGLGFEGYESFIQTDASINPGNSGGALLNLRGELIGINTAILSASGGNIGIGFAIPINMARGVADQIIKHGQVQRGQLGVSVQDLTPQLAQAFGLKIRKGVVISQVQPGSAAAKAGLQAGDVVVALDGEEVSSAAALRNRIGLMRIGGTVELTVLRDGKQRQVKATIGEAAGDQASPVAGSGSLEGAGLVTVEVTENGNRQQRVGVIGIEPGSPAERAGLREGDLIVSVNRKPITDVEGLLQALRATQDNSVLYIRRGEAAFFLPLQQPRAK